MSPLVCSSSTYNLPHLYSTIFSKDLWLLSQTKYGIYDQADATDPAILHHYYGAGELSPDDTDDSSTHPMLNEDNEDR